MSAPVSTAPSIRDSGLAGFPPTRRFLLVPRRPRRAVSSSLALYEAVEAQQRIVLAVSRAAAAIGVGRLLPVVELPEGLDVDWWDRWMGEKALSHVGTVAYIALRVPPNGRMAALLMDRTGRPLGFVKQLTAPPGELDMLIAEALNPPPPPFSTPRLLDEGVLQGVLYRLYAPLPAGAHHRPPHAPARVREVLDAWQGCMAGIVRPASAAHDGVVCHGDFTPRNLRVAGDGSWWLIDWENARWGPRLADELHYWCAEFSWRLVRRLARDAQRILTLLRERGTDVEIAAAAAWPDAPPRTYRARERDLRRAVGALVTVHEPVGLANRR